jgi:hypothetical protein
MIKDFEKPPNMPDDWLRGFAAACDLLIADMNLDRYGVGNMCSQWTAEEIGEDLKTRVMEAWNDPT